jgi:hypothetical protein
VRNLEKLYMGFCGMEFEDVLQKRTRTRSVTKARDVQIWINTRYLSLLLNVSRLASISRTLNRDGTSTWVDNIQILLLEYQFHSYIQQSPLFTFPYIYDEVPTPSHVLVFLIFPVISIIDNMQFPNPKVAKDQV